MYSELMDHLFKILIDIRLRHEINFAKPKLCRHNNIMLGLKRCAPSNKYYIIDILYTILPLHITMCDLYIIAAGA